MVTKCYFKSSQGSLCGRVIYEQRPKGSEGSEQWGIWGRGVQAKETASAKALKQWWVCHDVKKWQEI